MQSLYAVMLSLKGKRKVMFLKSIPGAAHRNVRGEYVKVTEAP